MEILPTIQLSEQIEEEEKKQKEQEQLVQQKVQMEVEMEDPHTDIFIDNNKQEEIKKVNKYSHLAKAREKALEVRQAKAKIRNEEKERKREEKEKKKAETLERRREKARERYWKKKLDKEIEQEQEMKKKEVEQKEVEQKEVKPQNSSISYEQFEQYMDKYKSKRNQHKSDEKPADYPKLKSRKNHHNFF